MEESTCYYITVIPGSNWVKLFFIKPPESVKIVAEVAELPPGEGALLWIGGQLIRQEIVEPQPTSTDITVLSERQNKLEEAFDILAEGILDGRE